VLLVNKYAITLPSIITEYCGYIIAIGSALGINSQLTKEDAPVKRGRAKK